MVLEAGSDPFPDFDKVIAVFFLGEHPHIAVQITSAGEAVQINHEFDAGLLRPVHRPLQIIEFAVQPSVILFEIKLRAHLAPVARQLGANQVDVPLFQRPDVLVPDGSRRHHAAQAAVAGDLGRVAHLPIEIDALFRREKRSRLERGKVEFHTAVAVLQPHDQRTGRGAGRKRF